MGQKWKKHAKSFGSSEKSRTFAPAIEKQDDWRNDIGVWCNGNTTDSGPVILGSSPSTPTIKSAEFLYLADFFYSILVVR